MGIDVALDEVKRPPRPPKRVRVPRDVQAAVQERRRAWTAMLDCGEVRSRADLARKLGVSRAYVTQVLGPMPKKRRADRRPARPRDGRHGQ